MSENARKHVLIVEDDDSIATALEYVLTQAGLAHDRVADGGVAVEHIRKVRPSIVLLDVMLPGVSGYDICSIVRSDPNLDSVRILMMTASGAARERAIGMALGADAFLLKPFDLKTLRDMISGLLVSRDRPGASDADRSAKGP